METSTLTDALLLSNNGGFNGNNNILWLFLLLGYNGFGGYGANGRGSCATTEDLASAFNFNGLQDKTNDILSSINGVNTNLGNAICQLGYQNAKDFGSLLSEIGSTSCTTQLGLKDVKFDMANYTASINANTTAGIQKILDKMNESENRALASKVQQLELQQALCGVPRINPNAYGVFPYGTNYAFGSQNI